ncbi:putative assembly protein [Pseudomonas fluorescens]|uniref:Cell envelope biogenesis protein AsmA n=1 Tax=Pseudomonas azotoformans TaxID=47878 RepID=A0A4V1K1K9_PSEAZ|nr:MULTISPECIES: AsmA family protein [Pseudomonas]KRP96796.1 cell envelope biogenesis protein AsmA [Pseudomonas lactis]KWV81476.1 putative assembly protein [Pseudomonas fluorescens]MBJ2305140.1 AsmA family protein [Pseudomonas sp. MF2846]MBK3490910.1 AsmA family protein [Pseudomonas sp. MF2857]MCR8662466.1 AsmA family protein [Pseudomonas carnis]
MKAFGKILGLVLLGLLLIIVALGFALTHLFDPNDYKEEIRQIARDKAHIELTLNGDIGWSLFPWLGLELHEASVATLTAPTQPFADLQMLGLSVRVLPLLRREVQMSDVRVEGLNLRLNRDKQGHGNWEDIGKNLPDETAGAPAPAPVEPVAETKPEKPPQPIRLDIDSLTINNARVEYTDEQTGKQLSAESIQLSAGAIHEGASIPLKLTAFLGSNQPLMRVKTELNGNLRIQRALKRYQFEDMRLSGEATGEPLQGKTVSFSTQGQLLVDLAANVAEWTNLKLAANQLRALGELKANDLDKTPQISGALSVAQFDLAKFLESVGHPLPAMAPGSLSKVELVSRLKGTPTSVALEDLNLKLDASTFTGRVAVDDFAKQSLRVQLKGDTFNADNYLPAKSEAAKGATAARQAEVQSSEAGAMAAGGSTPLPEAPTKGAWSNDKLLPLTRLRSLDVNADLAFGELTLSQLPIQNAVLKASGIDGQLKLDTLSGGLYNGTFQANGTLDVRQDTPVLALQSHIKQVPVERILQAQGKNPPVKGQLTLDSNLTGRGNSQKALIDSLNGTTSIVINNGVLLNANIEQQLCTGIALLNRKTLSATPGGKDTPFQELRGNLTFRNGVASNPDLKVRIPGLTLNGNGDVDLRVLGMDYRVGIIVEGDKRDVPDPACQVGANFQGIEVPLRCRGPLELGAKACRLDKDGLGQVALKAAGNRLNEKLEEKLDKVNPKLKDALKGLFNR